MKIVEFRQTGVFEILSMLRKEKLKVTDIIKSVPQQSTYKALSVLLSLKLIAVERGMYNQKLYFLTDVGKQVATKLAEIEKILQED